MPAFHPDEMNAPHRMRAQSLRGASANARTDRVIGVIIVIAVAAALLTRALGFRVRRSR